MHICKLFSFILSDAVIFAVAVKALYLSFVDVIVIVDTVGGVKSILAVASFEYAEQLPALSQALNLILDSPSASIFL